MVNGANNQYLKKSIVALLRILLEFISIKKCIGIKIKTNEKETFVPY